MTAGDVDRAILIFTKARSLPEASESRTAQELLALARERKGQLAHAKAEYAAYLERYPEGEGADRVRQRLAALVTARAEPIEPKREALPEVPPFDFRSFGSVYAGYRREKSFPEDEASRVIDSSIFTDVHLETRMRTDRYTIRTQHDGRLPLRVSRRRLRRDPDELPVHGDRGPSAGPHRDRSDGAP